MALETGTFTNDLVPSNPVAADGVGQGDDHIRLIKNTLKNTFAGFTSVALASSQAQLDAAVAAAVTGTAASVFKPGTAAAPGIAPLGNANTGIYQPAANQIGISVGGVASALFSSSGLAVTGNVTASGGIAGALVVSTGAYSGGTGQLVPIGGTLIWWDDVLPAEGGYAWANGQIIASANTVCPILLARWGNRYGGNGTTTMGVPNLQEAAPVGRYQMGTNYAATGRLSSIGSTPKTVLGSFFGEDQHTLLIAEMPSHYHSAGISDPGHAHTTYTVIDPGSGQTGGGAFHQTTQASFSVTTSSNVTGVRVNSPNGLDTTYSNGGGGAHNNVQPSTTCNFIIRIA